MQKVGLVVPCYNEADRLQVDAFLSFLTSHDHYHILFVNDGSTDQTKLILGELAKRNDHIDILNLEHNSGKAEAVRAGVLHLSKHESFPFIGFLDADLATPLNEILAFEKLMYADKHCKLVLGSRWKRLGSRIQRSTFRHYLGRLFATVVSLLFGLSVYDTQCGAKLFRNENLDIIFGDSFVSNWFFDIEIICRYQRQYQNKPVDDWAAEIPIHAWNEIGGSRIKFLDFITAPWALLKIKWHYRN